MYRIVNGLVTIPASEHLTLVSNRARSPDIHYLQPNKHTDTQAYRQEYNSATDYQMASSKTIPRKLKTWSKETSRAVLVEFHLHLHLFWPHCFLLKRFDTQMQMQWSASVLNSWGMH